jgi:NitT/TauT family transport system ATP-binding protein
MEGGVRRGAYIRIEDLAKTFRSARGDVLALDGVTLDIVEGEFLTLVGPSGCGKTTLLRCLAGLETPTRGRLCFGDGAERPAKLGIVFQRDVLLDWRTVVDNVLLTIEFRGLERRAWRDSAYELLGRYGLGGFEERYPWELSGGMRQRVAICRAIIDDPPLLLMDEPFAALDAFTRDELNLELQRIWEETGKTIVFVTHSIQEAVFLSDRVLVMTKNPGRAEELLEIGLARPRRLGVRDTAEFGAYSGRIRETFERLGIMGRAP